MKTNEYRRLYFDCDPVAKARVRLSPRTGGVYTPQPTRLATDWIRSSALDQLGALSPLSGPIEMQGVLVYRLPRRHPDHLFKDTKPDGTNLIKLVEDALNPMCIGGYEVFQGAYTDDARIVYETWAKMWATPRIPRGIYVILREVSADQEEELSEWVYKTFVSPWRR